MAGTVRNESGQVDRRGGEGPENCGNSRDVGGVAGYILPNSANLVGVSIMALSLVKLLPRHGWSDYVDEMLAVASVTFLTSVALSYASLRLGSHASALELWAEKVFLLGLAIMIVAATILAFCIG